MIVIILILAPGCKTAPEQIATRDTRVQVAVRPAEKMQYKIPVRSTGILVTATQMKLSFKTGGIIRQIDVREGESVRKGEVLATLDLSEIRAQANQARIGYEKAQRDLTRAGNLYRDSVVTLEQYQNAQSAVDMAKFQNQIADFNLQHSRIKAPSNGKIQKILVESNEIIAPGYPAILFASTDNNWIVRTSLIDKEIVRLGMGDSAMVTMDAFPGKRFRGEITELGTVADPVTGTYEVELMLLASLPQFRSGFFSRVRIYPSEIMESLVVPLEAVMDASDNRAYVFVYEAGRAIKKRISTGQLLDDAVTVTDGLAEGELVITRGAKYLREDLEVNLVNDPDTISP